MHTPELRDIPLTAIRVSGTNPRKDFESEGAKAYLADLAASIRHHGVLQAALVRPAYCVDRRNHAEIAKVRAPWDLFVLVAGECRWRASEMAGNDTMPCVVRELTDDDAREAQQIENLHRRGLAPLEEAQGFEEMLALHDDAGSPRYTIASLAERIGLSVRYVYTRLALLRLPLFAKSALASGQLSVKVATLISGVPTPEMREQFARRVIEPELALEPLSIAEATRVRDEHFVQYLKAAPFPLDDAALLSSAGTCLACPKMSGNVPHLFDGAVNAVHGNTRVCLDPGCYRAKVSALFQRRAAVRAGWSDGARMLPEGENTRVFPPTCVSGMMAPTSPFVDIAKRPEEHLIKREVPTQQRGTWRQLVEKAEAKTGAKLERVMAHDQDHVLRELVDVKAAIALIEKGGDPIFRDRASERGVPSPSYAATAAEKKAEQDEAKLRKAGTHAGLTALHEALGKGWDTGEVWDALFDLAMSHAGPAGLSLVAEWRGLPPVDGDFAVMDAVTKWTNGLETQERDNLLPLLLVAADMRLNGTRSVAFRLMAEALGVDVAAIEKAAKAAVRPPAKKAKLTAAELAEKVRELRAQGKNSLDTALALCVSLRRVNSIVSKLEVAEAAALSGKVTQDPKILTQWVKARGEGMSIAEIARSYNVSEADVSGALSEQVPLTGKKKGGTK